jgi:hypothetical protein
VSLAPALSSLHRKSGKGHSGMLPTPIPISPEEQPLRFEDSLGM